MKSFPVAKRATLGAAMLSICLLTPELALAEGEEGSSGISLLIPALAELIPAIIAFIIIFAVLSKLVWPAVVKMMADREQAIADGFKASDEAKEHAKEIDREAEELLAKARNEAADIVASAKRDAEDERTRILAEAKIEAADTIEKGHQAVDSERRRAMNELSRSVVDLSVEIAGRILETDLDDKEHRALAERYLAEMGSDDAQ